MSSRLRASLPPSTSANFLSCDTVRLMNLWADFLVNKDRVIHKWKHYFPIYERHFSRYVYRPVTIIEVGCGEGGSLQMWKRYFGPHARVIGIDVDPQCIEFAEDQIEIRIGSQSDVTFLEGIISEFGQPDIVIDDGSHLMSDVCTTFDWLYPQLNSTGIYMVEDMHTAYWPEFGGGYRCPGTFIERCKDLVDELNADYAGEQLPPTVFTRSTLSIHFYDSVVVFERGHNTRKFAPRIGCTD